MSEVAEAVRDHAGSRPEDDTGVGDARQFVIFHVADEMFAVPLAEVQEIIRMPDVVHVPLSPAALEGLANLRGTVLPVIRLRQIFGMEPVEHDDATRVVILDQGRPSASWSTAWPMSLLSRMIVSKRPMPSRAPSIPT